MAFNMDAHIDFALRTAPGGGAVVFGTQKGWGLLDTGGIERNTGGGFQMLENSVHLVVRDGAFSGLTEDATITHNGIDYTIRDTGDSRTDGTRVFVVTADA